MAYEVKFEAARSYHWFYTRVFCDGELIAEKACCKDHKRAARWASRRIRSHQAAMRILFPLVEMKVGGGEGNDSHDREHARRPR